MERAWSVPKCRLFELRASVGGRSTQTRTYVSRRGMQWDGPFIGLHGGERAGSGILGRNSGPDRRTNPHKIIGNPFGNDVESLCHHRLVQAAP